MVVWNSHVAENYYHSLGIVKQHARFICFLYYFF
jgi:hypothetical protein